MSNAFLPLAKRFAKEAVEADENEEYEKAYVMYRKAIDRYSFAVKHEKDPRKRKKMERAVARYSKRKDALHETEKESEEKKLTEKEPNERKLNHDKKSAEKLRLRRRRHVDRQNDRFRKRIVARRSKDEEPLDQVIIPNVEKLRIMLCSDVITTETNLNARFGWAVKQRRCCEEREKREIEDDMLEASCEMMCASIWGIELRPGKWKVRAICRSKRSHYLRANDTILIKKTLNDDDEYVLSQVNLDVSNGLVQITGDAEIVALEFFPLQFFSLVKKKMTPTYWCKVNMTIQGDIFFGACTKIHMHHASNAMKTAYSFFLHEEPSSLPVRISFGRSSTLPKGWVNSERNIPKIDYLEFAFASDQLHPSLRHERKQNRLVDLKFKLFQERALPLLIDAEDSESTTGYLLRLGLLKHILKEYVAYSIKKSKLSSHSWMFFNVNNSDEKIVRDTSGSLDFTMCREKHVWMTQIVNSPKRHEAFYGCWTIEAVVVMHQFNQEIIQYVSDMENLRWSLDIHNGCLQFELIHDKDSLAYEHSIVSLTPLMKGVSTHVAVTMMNCKPRLYINGRLDTLDTSEKKVFFPIFHSLALSLENHSKRFKMYRPQERTLCACVTFCELGPDEFRLLT